MKTITIEVNKKDIKKGIKHQYNRCPIARAIRRTLSKAKKIAVGTDNIKFILKKHLYYINSPPKAVKFMNNFDSGKQVKPISFRLKFNDYCY